MSNTSEEAVDARMNGRPGVAFVGLGAIGLPMAVCLGRAGFDVIGVEPTESGRERAREVGIRAVASIGDVEDAEIIVVMVATPDQLTAVVDGAQEHGVGAGACWVVMSTVGPDAVRREASRIIARGGSAVDAPVSGGVVRARTGELSLFVAGAADDLAAVRDLLEAMGTPRIVGAAVGDGQAVKVVNQHLCSVHLVAAAEALALAEGLGLDPAFVLDVVGGGAAASFMLGDRGPRMLESPDAPVLSQIGIFVKDSGLVADAGAAASVELPLLDAARDRFLRAADGGLRTHDDSSVIETYRRRTP